MSKNYKIDDIENFLNDRMETAEREAFSRKMAEDPELQKEVQWHAAILKGIDQAAEQDLRQLVGKVHDELKTEGFFAAETTEKETNAPIRPLRSRRWLTLAASLLVLLLASWWMFFRPLTPERLYANHFSTPTDVLSVEVASRLSESGFGTNVSALTQLREAMQSFQVEDFAKARSLLQNFQLENPNDGLIDYAAFYEALAAMKEGDFKAAQSLLTRLAGQAAFPLQHDARWYLALNYLQSGDVARAKEWLNAIPKDSRYAPASEQLLRQLK